MMSIRRRFPGVFSAYMVSWFPDIVYAEIVIEPDDANVNYYGRYDFSNSSATGWRHGCTTAVKKFFQVFEDSN